LQLKDYAGAQKHLRAAVEQDPNNVENIYPLGLAYLTATPPDEVNGIFFMARAANLIADAKAKGDVTKFARSRYVKYHGSDEGWNELLAQTATAAVPPADFTIKEYVPPTPAEQAADLVKSKKPQEMSFAEWQLVLSVGSQADQDTVWNALKGKALQMAEVKVIKSSPTELQIAGSQDDIEANRADIVLSFPAPIPARSVPVVGSKINFEGTPVSYTSNPFVMTMEKGALLTMGGAPAPKKSPVRKKSGRSR
jgi:hypothetical protein